tara:strand:+ start:1017 stop:1514 length:498 start_codon:yes stop_codon:yes gene_type:complete
MDKEFITIGEAARFLKQSDVAVMRLIKEALSAGLLMEEIMKKEMRGERMMYLVSKDFLTQELNKEKESLEEEALSDTEFAKAKEEPKEASQDLLEVKNEMIATLQKIVDTKDHQIEDLSGKIDQLIERDHETNILLKGLQDRLFLLEQGSQSTQKKSSSKNKNTQ